MFVCDFWVMRLDVDEVLGVRRVGFRCLKSQGESNETTDFSRYFRHDCC